MRQLLRTPVISAIAIATLALSTGATTAIFSVVYGVLLRPLPYRDAADLVQLNTVRQQGAAAPANFSLAEFEDLLESSQSVRELAAFATDQFSLAVPGEAAEAIRGAVISDGFFPLLGTTPEAGRFPGAEGATEDVVVISGGLWRRRFAADPEIAGTSIQLNGRSWSIAGVAPASMSFPTDDIDVWVPLGVVRQTAPPQWNMRGYRIFSIIGRLAPNTPLVAAQDEAAAIARAWQRDYPRFSADLTATAIPLSERVMGTARPALLLLMAASAMVLLIACTNLTSLLLSRNVTRAREFAVRVALGARAGHLLRVSAAEAGWLAALGSLGGVALAAMALRVLPALAPLDLPRLGDVRIDTPVLVFVLGVTVLVTMVLGSAIGFSAWRASTSRALGDARTRTDRRTRRVQAALVAAQVALSLALVVTASLLTRSLGALMNAPVGAANAEALTMKLSAVSRPFLDRALPQIAALPGVRAVGVISSLPPNVSQMHTTVSAVSPRTGANVDASVDIVSVSPGAFDALGIRVVRGRTFTEADLSSDRRMLIINELTADRLFPGVDAVGRTLPFGPVDASGLPPLIVGVVTNVQYGGLDAPPDGAIYLPYTKRPFAMTHLVIESSSGADAALLSAVRDVVRSVDPGQALSEIRPLDAVISRAASPARFRAVMLSSLAGLALLLSVMGLYAVMAHAVGTRIVEIGVRMALGSTGAEVRALILRQGLTLAAIGVMAGMLPAYFGARIVARFLYGVSAMDPMSIAGSIAVLIVTAAAAVTLPALRASRVPPIVALRHDSQ